MAAHVPARLLRTAGDDRLVALVRSGSEPAFEAIYDRHHRKILSFCRHLVGNQQEAEDAVQQTFLSAYRGLLRSDKVIILRPWLYTIARNQCVNAMRARRERTVAEPDDHLPAPDGLTDQVQRREDLRELLVDLQRLPEEQRSALVLSELDDLSHEEIGAVVGVRRDKVKALVFQAREALAGARDARAIPCGDIREQIATARGGALRRAPLRRHIAACDGCRGFRDEVSRQRRAMAAVLPVVPSAALKAGSLPWLAGGGGAAGGGAVAGGAAAVGGGSAAASGGGAAGFASVTALAGSSAAKVLAIGAVAIAGTAGGVVGVKELRAKDTPPSTAQAPSTAGARTPSANASPTGLATTPPQSTSSQGVTPERRAGKGGNTDLARERARAKRRRERAKRAKGERGRSENAPGQIAPADEDGNGSAKRGGSNAGGNGGSNAGGNGNGNGSTQRGGSNAGGNGNGNGSPASRPAPAATPPVPAPTTGGGNTNSNGNGAVNGGGAKANGTGATD